MIRLYTEKYDHGIYTLASSVVKCDGSWQITGGIVKKIVLSISPTHFSERMSVVL